MEAKTAVIIGSVALIGVGAFIYFKPKKPTITHSTQAQMDALQNQVDNATATTSGVSSSNNLTTPAQVVAVVTKINEATDILNKIKDIQKAKDVYLIDYSTGGKFKFAYDTQSGVRNAVAGQLAVYDNDIRDFDTQLLALGYKQVNGTLVKIV